MVKGQLLFVLKHLGFLLELFRFWISCCYKPSIPDTENYPHVAIIGGGIGGVALAVACLHRGIPFTIYERDNGFEARSQGYGLTLQQASKAIEGLGVFSLEESNFHQTFGSYYRWKSDRGMGMRKWMQSEAQNLQSEPIYISQGNLCAARTTRWT
jgi:2-polyprenyl-6-methoxyphenol hydroxylase-like FAD-dependent oxidoreductase